MAGLWLGGVAGCSHIGPTTIVDDRIPYNDAISTSWKQQTLLNIVRLRYSDVPEFVDIPSAVNGYEHGYSTAGGLSLALNPSRTPLDAWNADLSGSHTMIDRPTITYAPQTNSEFIRNITNPIPPASILNLIEAGNPADVVMELAVESINGIRNRRYAGGFQQSDPEFEHVTKTIRRAQESGYVSLRVLSSGDPRNPDVLMTIWDKDIPPELAAELQEMRSILRINPDAKELRVVFGMLPEDPSELAIRTRSILRMMLVLALNVQVPECHLAEGRAIDLEITDLPENPPMTVYSSCEKPEDYYAAVYYQGHWFWIDPRDFASKRTMLFMKLLLAFADTGNRELAPTLTIRAN